MPSTKTYDKALDTLDGLATITKNEMLSRGVYLSEELDEEKKAEGAICGGHRACLIGSLWLSYGIKPKLDEFEDLYLPGVGEIDRPEFLRNRPALRTAYAALNLAAERDAGLFNALERINSLAMFGSQAERLFETRAVERPDLLRLVNHAKRIVRADRRKEHGR